MVKTFTSFKITYFRLKVKIGIMGTGIMGTVLMIHSDTTIITYGGKM